MQDTSSTCINHTYTKFLARKTQVNISIVETLSNRPLPLHVTQLALELLASLVVHNVLALDGLGLHIGDLFALQLLKTQRGQVLDAW